MFNIYNHIEINLEIYTICIMEVVLNKKLLEINEIVVASKYVAN